MPQVNDAEYLQRPLIEGMEYKIEEDSLRISCSHTIYAQGQRFSALRQDSLLSLYQDILKTAKGRKIKISYTSHYKKEITEQWTEYEEGCAEAGALFSKIIVQAKVVKGRGIHFGTTDDAELKKLEDMLNDYSRFFWRNNVTSKIASIQSSLDDLLARLNRSGTSSRIVQISL